MKNIVGQTPRGEDFFPRDQLINLIYRRLEGGSNVFLSASRRVGKTSLMRFLEDNPREHFHFIYVITESVQGKEEYFRRLLEEILRSEALSKLAELSERSKNVVKDILGRIKSL
ncbi:MAG: ATP-binding protein, partial [Bacteroidota bacterium]